MKKFSFSPFFINCFVETYIKDHLGNVRVAYANDGIKDGIRQVNAYYPFGMNIKSLSANSTSVLHRNEYLYNGKMVQDELGLNWLDYGARFYDPVVGRWWSEDPMAETFFSTSPYVYCKNNPINLFDPDGLYPASILVYDPKIGLHGGYHFTQSAVTLLSLVSGVSSLYIENVVVQERAAGQYRPFYNVYNRGGGAITLGKSGFGASITFTQNFFADDPTAYNNHGYGKNIFQWLDLASHEVGHLPQIDEAGGLLNFVFGMAMEYALSMGHDNATSEKEANQGQKTFEGFNTFINSRYGNGALTDLFESNAKQSKKSATIAKWYGAYQESQNAKKKKATQSFFNNIQNVPAGTYVWNGTDWVSQ